MDFFSAQDQARRSTKRLVLWFILAVISLILITNLFLLAVFKGSSGKDGQATLVYSWDEFWLVTGVVSVVILCGTLYKLFSLRSGGAAIAESLGGSLVVSGSGDFKRQRLLNVVEEMAIASGMPVPPVYVMEHESGINAFAAGFETGDAVVAVTAGTLDHLSRDELQGVIAHEFSHIQNGDMRLNLRLIGVLHGILLIGLIGQYMLRGQRHSSGRGKGGAVLLGLGLMVIGYAGTFFGNIIKAAVSREREFLADASAVQFTRNPDSIAGALKQIGASSHGSIIEASNASEFSHAYFSEGVSGFFSSLFATHPPLEDRILRIDPRWDGEFGESRQIADATPEPDEAGSEQAAPARSGAEILAAILAGSAIAGGPGPDHLHYARELLAELPEALGRLIHEPHGARGVIFALVLDPKDEAIRQRQRRIIADKGDRGVPEALAEAEGLIADLDTTFRLPLVNIAMGTLRQLSPQQYTLFKTNLNALIETDSKVALFEWCLRKILFHGLDRAFGLRKPRKAQYDKLAALKPEVQQLLSLIVYASRQNGITPQQAFAQAVQKLGLDELEVLRRNELSLQQLDGALDRLDGLKIFRKAELLKACAVAITADRNIDVAEAELFRAVGEILDCPVPPLRIGE